MIRCIWSHSFSCVQDDRAQAPGDVDRNHFGQRTGNPDRAGIGLDTKVMLLQAEVVGIGLCAALEVVARAVFGIDVDRADQPLFPEPTFGRHRPAQAKQTSGGDLHGVPFGPNRRCGAATVPLRQA
jgi:hypothetical protein